MTHYRIIGSVWLLFGVIGFVLSAIEGLRCLNMGDPLTDGAVVSSFIASIFCALAAVTSIGLFRARGWARICGTIMAIIFSLYCLSFILMVGLEYGAFWFLASCLGVLLSAYTLTVIWVFRPPKQNTS